MNLLSCGALITAILYVVLIARRSTGSRMDKLNLWSLLVCAFLGWWTFCDAFFYVAKTADTAWLWHHLSAIGWCGFIPVTCYYFLIMTHTDEKLNTLPRQIAYWGFPVALTLCFVFHQPTALAEDLIPSKSGLGWTFVQHYSTPWPFIFLLMLIVYFGSAFWLLSHMKPFSQKVNTLPLALGFIVLDIISITVGFLSLFVIPFFTDYLPPMGFIATLIFIVGYRYELWAFDLMHIELALSPGSIFESSLDAMLITDEHFVILYANTEARRVLGNSDALQTDFTDYLSLQNKNELLSYFHSNQSKLQLEMDLSSGIPVICSINHSQTKKHRQNVFIISLHDIGPLRIAQTKLHYLAHYDELTGLPNRRKLGMLLDEWALNSRSNNCDFELLFLDLNNFKSINDNFGHHAGDEALKAVASALNTARSEQDVVARLAGDEFVLLHALSGTSSAALPERINQTLAAVDCHSFAPGYVLSASIGCCRFSEAPDIRTLFKLADERMYKAKDRHYQLFPDPVYQSQHPADKDSI